MKAYKITDINCITRTITLWGEGVSHTATGTGTWLCTDGFLHFYTNPILAVLMNPIHGCYQNPLLWECETSGKHIHESLKSGCKTLTTLKQIPFPKVTQTHRIIFAILCVKRVFKGIEWNKWADDWLSNKDRSTKAAIASSSNTDCATFAGYAANYASLAASYSSPHSAASAAAYTAHAEACNSYYDTQTIDFVAIAKQALTYK